MKHRCTGHDELTFYPPSHVSRAYDYSPEEKGALALQQEAPTVQATTKSPQLPQHVGFPAHCSGH